MSKSPDLSSGHKQDWEDLAEFDAMWAILSDPAKKGGRWELNEFFSTGREEIESALRLAEELGAPERWHAALDFGCGYGRLTRALGERFDRSVGVDVSSEMIEGAKRLNAEHPACEFFVNDAPDLALFEDAEFDLIFTKIVLQHIADREVILNYVREFLRVLVPGGLAIFELPSHIPLKNRIQPAARAYRALRAVGVPPDFLFRRLHLQPMRMTFVTQEAILEAVTDSGAKLLKIVEEPLPGGSISSTYFVTK